MSSDHVAATVCVICETMEAASPYIIALLFGAVIMLVVITFDLKGLTRKSRSRLQRLESIRKGYR